MRNIENERVCLSVEYVEGHVEPASSFILFRCSTTGTEHRQVTLSFLAPSDQTSMSIVCIATTTTGFNQSLAVLMIQGNRTQSLY